MKTENISDEIEHSRRIRYKAEAVWGWSTPAGRVRIARRIRLLKEAACLDSAKTVLELGCGTGVVSRGLSGFCRELVATEISEELLSDAIAGPKKPNLHYLRCDAHKICFRDGAFDCVVGNSILHHLDMWEALREVRRILRPGGRMAFAEPNMLNPQIVIQKNIPLIKKLLGDSVHESAIIRFRLEAQLKRLEFRDVKIIPFDFLHPYTPRFLIGAVSGTGAFLEKVPIVREIAGSLLIAAER